MTDPKTEALLRRFLEEDAAARKKGTTIEAVHAAVLRIAADRLTDRIAAADDRRAVVKLGEAFARLVEAFSRHSRRIRSLERQMEAVSAQPQVPDWRPDPMEITGTHDLAEIKRAAVRAAQHDELIEARKWWREHLWLGVGACLLALATGCGGYLAAHYALAPITTTPEGTHR